MAPRKRNKPSETQTRTQNESGSDPGLLFEGDRLTLLVKSFNQQIESQKNSTQTLPEKLFIKQQFAVGVNEVTRILERVDPTGDKQKLQAVMIAADCNPKWLTKHLPNLAALRNVAVIFVKDSKKGSLRLGEIVRVKTAIAIGIKDKGTSINQFVRKILGGESTDSIDLAATQ